MACFAIQNQKRFHITGPLGTGKSHSLTLLVQIIKDYFSNIRVIYINNPEIWQIISDYRDFIKKLIEWVFEEELKALYSEEKSLKEYFENKFGDTVDISEYHKYFNSLIEYIRIRNPKIWIKQMK